MINLVEVRNGKKVSYRSTNNTAIVFLNAGSLSIVLRRDQRGDLCQLGREVAQIVSAEIYNVCCLFDVTGLVRGLLNIPEIETMLLPVGQSAKADHIYSVAIHDIHKDSARLQLSYRGEKQRLDDGNLFSFSKLVNDAVENFNGSAGGGFGERFGFDIVDERERIFLQTAKIHGFGYLENDRNIADYTGIFYTLQEKEMIEEFGNGWRLTENAFEYIF